MTYHVNYSAEAKQDLRDIYSYIAFKLLEPDTAAGQTQRIMDAVLSLNNMPMRHTLYEDEPWHSLGLRYLPVDNYVIYYLPDNSTYTVDIIRIMYSGRDAKNQLKPHKKNKHHNCTYKNTIPQPWCLILGTFIYSY